MGGINNIIKLVSTVLAACAVPIFFFFSGYLFFAKTEELTKEIYVQKLKSRAKSLLIPYFFWIMLGVVSYGFLAYLPFTRDIFGQGNFELSWRYLGEQFTGFRLVDGKHNYEMCYHLWFLRDLFLMVIISPLIYYAVRHNNRWTVLLLVILWILPLPLKINTSGIVFFGLGAYYGVNRINFISGFESISTLSYILYPCFVLADWFRLWTYPLYTLSEFYIGILHDAMILTAIPFWCNLTALLVRKKNIKMSTWLGQASFFVYLCHIPFILPQIKKILYHIVNPQSQGILVILYFGTVFCSVIVALILYRVIQKHCPKLTKVITGGR